MSKQYLLTAVYTPVHKPIAALFFNLVRKRVIPLQFERFAVIVNSLCNKTLMKPRNYSVRCAYAGAELFTASFASRAQIQCAQPSARAGSGFALTHTGMGTHLNLSRPCLALQGCETQLGENQPCFTVPNSLHCQTGSRCFFVRKLLGL